MAEARYKITADDRSNKAIRSAKQNLVAFRKSVLNVRTAMVALAGAAAMGAAIKKSAEFGNNIGKAADVAGVTTDTLQELRFAFGQLAEVTDGQVDQALQKFRRRLDLARDGTGAARDVLDKLNISLEQDTDAALDSTIRKLTRLAMTEDITGEASQLFGEEVGPKLAAAIAQGEDAVRKLREETEKLTSDQIRGAEELTDEFDQLARTIKVRLTGAVLDYKDEWLAVGRALEHVIELGGEVARVLGGEGAVNPQTEQIRELQSEYQRLFDEQRRLIAEGDTEVAGFLDRRMDEVERAFNRLGVARREFLEVGGAGLGIRESGGFARAELSDSLRLLDQIDAKRRAMLGAGEMPSEAGLNRGGNPLEAWGKAAESANDELRVSRELLHEIDRQAIRMADDASGAMQHLEFTFSSAFEDAIVKGQELRTVLQGLLQDVIRIALRTTVTQPLGNAFASAIMGALGGVGGGASGTAGTGGSPGPVEAFGFAKGGIVDRPTIALAGEAGPEAFFPLTRRGGELGLRGSGGGGSPVVNITNNIDARGADKGAIVQMERTLLEVNRSIETRAVAAMREAQARG